MILVAVDDLMFTSKIATAARQLGVDVVFARTAAETVDRARTLAPALIILDLDGRRTEPLTAVAALKNDPTLAKTRTVAFVRHTETDLIARARAAGIDDVMARSAFVANLAGILKP